MVLRAANVNEDAVEPVWGRGFRCRRASARRASTRAICIKAAARTVGLESSPCSKAVRRSADISGGYCAADFVS
jgi:hypothetical protein